MILTLCIILFLLLLLVGGNRGLDSFFALVKIILSLIVSIYLIAWGMHPFLAVILISFLFIIFVLYIQNGKNNKMHAATISVILVLIFVWAFTGPILLSATPSGYNEIEQYEEISMYLSSDLSVPMGSVFLCAVLLGILGAITDTAVAVITVVNEVYITKPDLNKKELFLSGLSVGKDIIGTTVNTLFFAGIGESIMLAVLFMKNQDSFASILNSKAFFQEVSALLISATGCLLIIPVSSMVIATLLTSSRTSWLDKINYKKMKNLIKRKNVLKN